MDNTLLTPVTHPDHDVIGSYFHAWDDGLFYCDSYEPRTGFWMTSVVDPAIRRNVSERAIHRTFHLLYGIVRPHHAHPSNSDYHLVDLDSPEQAPVPFNSALAATHKDPRKVMAFNRFDAKRFHDRLKAAALGKPLSTD